MSDRPADIIKRLEVFDDTLKLAEALRVAARALGWYAKESNWGDDDWGVRAVVQPPDYGDAGGKARSAIKRIDRILADDSRKRIRKATRA